MKPLQILLHAVGMDIEHVLMRWLDLKSLQGCLQPAVSLLTSMSHSAQGSIMSGWLKLQQAK